MGNRCTDDMTPLYPQKLALTLPTGGGRSVGIVRSRTKAMEFSYYSLNVHTQDTTALQHDYILTGVHLSLQNHCQG
jgi:hypothetical protein